MQRQIPQEVLFKTNSLSSWQDPTKKNRYHFKFPINWTTSAQKEAIIGIRSLYIVPSYKRAMLTVRASIQYHETPGGLGWYELEDTVVHIMVSKFFDDNIRLVDFTTKINDAFKEEFKPDIPGIELARPLRCHYQYVVKNEFEHDCQFVIESPYNMLDESKRAEVIGEESGENYYRYHRVKFEIEEINEDAITLLHFATDAAGTVIDPRGDDASDPNGTYKTDSIVTHGVYDYNQCILYSNLAYMDEDSFLGHTRRHVINPIKYYELKNNNQSFWVDLYAAGNHKVAIELNKGDALYIEAQLLMTNEAVL